MTPLCVRYQAQELSVRCLHLCKGSYDRPITTPELRKRAMQPESLPITILQSWPSRDGPGRRVGNIQVCLFFFFLVNPCHSEGGCFSAELSQLLLGDTTRAWLSVPSLCQPGEGKQEVVTLLIEQIKNASSQDQRADLPSVPPGPSEAAAMLSGAGGGQGWPRDLGLLCPQTLSFGWGCICCGGMAVL